jgi:hypothetical protein
MRPPRLSYANVIATVALFVALGGVGYAAVKLPRDSVGSKQIKEDAVKASELAPDSVDSFNVIEGSIAGNDILPNTLGGNQIAGGAIEGVHIADGTIGRAKLAGADIRTPTLEDCSPGTPWQPVPDLPPHYWKDNEGIVHLEGAVQCSVNISGASIFQIPRAFGDVYDPAASQSVARFATLAAGQSIAQVAVVKNTFTTGVVYDGGTAANSENYVSLDGLTYRASG